MNTTWNLPRALLIALTTSLALVLVIASSPSAHAASLGQGYSCVNGKIKKGGRTVALKTATAAIQAQIRKLGTSKKDKAKKKTLNDLKKALSSCAGGGSGASGRAFEVYSAEYTASALKTFQYSTAIAALPLAPGELPGAEKVCVTIDYSSNPTFAGHSGKKIVKYEGDVRSLCGELYSRGTQAEEIDTLCPAVYKEKRVVFIGAGHFGAEFIPKVSCLDGNPSICGITNIVGYLQNGVAGWRGSISTRPSGGCPK